MDRIIRSGQDQGWHAYRRSARQIDAGLTARQMIQTGESRFAKRRVGNDATHLAQERLPCVRTLYDYCAINFTVFQFSQRAFRRGLFFQIFGCLSL